VARIGVTGHMNLTPHTVPLVREAVRQALAPYAPERLTGVSCIAIGADSIFAEVVIDLGGTLEVILPAADYRDRKVKPEHTALFDNLVRRAARVRVMPYDVSHRDAYEAANEALVASSDRLLAVWDGRASTDRGATATVVQYARSKGLPLTIIWPEGAQRT
jgi:hypothetical protein